ncbi:hypothetical protein OG747_52975 (plasmid) [Streptomyces sp. NBC_01384]|uniref:hypothetical protein n=1 Tax=Streptomyces sp. NBC_01384 TaxID=2903847 RepID=UPI00324A3041
MVDVAEGRQVGLCALAGGQSGVPLLPQFRHLGIPCSRDAESVAGTGTEFLDT